MPTQRHCLSVFDNPDRKVIVSFNKTLVGRDFSTYLGCWEVNGTTYHCGEIPLPSDGDSQQELLSIVLPVVLTIVMVPIVGFTIYKYKKLRLQQQEAILKQQRHMAILNLDFTKAMQIRDLEMGIQSHH
jgi:hypothetical protein